MCTLQDEMLLVRYMHGIQFLYKSLSILTRHAIRWINGEM